MKSTPLACCHLIKIKTHGAIKSMARHHTRERPTPSADPDREAIILHGSGDPYADARRRLKEAEPPRSNAVLACELVLSASPSYFRPSDPRAYGEYEPEQVEAFAEAVTAWVLDRYGENCTSIVLHLDEATPHAHVVIVPVVAGRLNCRMLFSERGRLRALQDSYAKALEPLGIQRGVRGSTATHEQIKRWYEEEPRRLEAAWRELRRRAREGQRAIDEIDALRAEAERFVDDLAGYDPEAAAEARERLNRIFGPR